MSLFTDFRDSVVQSVVPEQFRDLDAAKAGQIAGSALVKVTEAPRSNQTAAQIANGQTGQATTGLAPMSSVFSNFKFTVPVMIAIGAAAFLLLRKRGR
jgi:hypothetical protein